MMWNLYTVKEHQQQVWCDYLFLDTLRKEHHQWVLCDYLFSDKLRNELLDGSGHLLIVKYSSTIKPC